MNLRELGKTLSAIENRTPKSLAILAECYQKRHGTPVLGMTGPPGAGKSTLTDQLITQWRGRGKTVAVLAVDPTSPFTGGAVLGDRVRMQRHAGDAGVFIRSIGSRGSHGGLAAAAQNLILCFDAAGFDRIIIETVGVGQTDLDVMGVATTTLVVFVPEGGDVVQTMKAGLTEIGDLFVVNKADRPGANDLRAMLLAMVEMQKSDAKKWLSPVLLTQANQGEGVAEVLAAIEEHFKASHKNKLRQQKELRQTLFLSLCAEALQESLRKKFVSDKKLKKVLADVAEGKQNPYEVAAECIRHFLKGA